MLFHSHDEARRREGGDGTCTSSTETISHPDSRFQPRHHFLSLHLPPCHFSLATPPNLSLPPHKRNQTLPVLLLFLLLSALLPCHLSSHSHSSSAHLRPSREGPLPPEVFAARRPGSLSRVVQRTARGKNHSKAVAIGETRKATG